MSRTYRSIPPRLSSNDEIVPRVKRGLVNIPINVNTDGFKYESVWKREAKRFWKRYLTKKNRRRFNQEVSMGVSNDR